MMALDVLDFNWSSMLFVVPHWSELISHCDKKRPVYKINVVKFIMGVSSLGAW